MKALYLFEMPEATHLTQCHILEGIRPQQHCCENFKSCLWGAECFVWWRN